MSEHGGNISDNQLNCRLELYCNSESLSVEGLRELIGRHGLTPNNNHSLISDYQFFYDACFNKRVDVGIIRYLLECFPEAISTTDENGRSPLQHACMNPNVTLDLVQLLIGAAPDSVRSVTKNGSMTLVHLCMNKKVDDAIAIQILKFIMEKNPEAVRHADSGGWLPIHFAARIKSPEFCRVLIEAYPGSERIGDDKGMLPLHIACWSGTLPTVEYLYRLYPDAINHVRSDGDGYYPIHEAIYSIVKRDDPAAAAEIVQFLLDCDPNVKLQKCKGDSQLDDACWLDLNDSNIDAALEMIGAIYDAHPEAIEDHLIAKYIHRFHLQVQTFVKSELVYARQARDHRLMTTPEDDGQLPLHTAIQNNVRLGSIKLFVKGNPQALRSPDNEGALPLHIACQHHDSTKVIDYLVGLDKTSLSAVDGDGNTAIHYVCRGANYETIALLLGKYDAVSVSKQNAQKKLPIELLWESNAVEDRESIEYTESIFRLLKAYPETLTNIDTEQQSASDARQSRSGKGVKSSRKFLTFCWRAMRSSMKRVKNIRKSSSASQGSP